MLNVLAVLFAITLYSYSPALLNVLIVSPALLLLLNPTRTHTPQKVKPPRSQHVNDAQGAAGSPESLPIHPFLTTYRAAMLIVTCIAILAVDFHVFPRRFAKVENWGTSLMDLGVGSFVFSAGVVSARSELRNRTNRSKKEALLRRLVTSARHSLPLLVLGLIRLYSVKGLDYAEHVTEYGVHWNFFFTLGLLPPFVEIFDSLTAFVPWYDVLAVGIAIAYQVALESTDLKAYILVSPRGPGLLSKNREGVFSFLGYLAIFLGGRATGIRAIPRGTSPTKSPKLARKSVLVTLAMQALVWTVLFLFNSTYALGYGAGIPVSRRLANMPYVLWVCAFNNAQIFLFCLLETLFFPSIHDNASSRQNETERISFATSRILAAYNKNGLAMFLVANLLTGAVNLSVRTIDVSTTQTMAILVGYAAVLTSVALFLDRMKIVLRL